MERRDEGAIVTTLMSLAVIAAGEGRAETPRCPIKPMAPQRCFTIRARLLFAADTPPFRLQPAGTRRLLAVGGLGGDSETEQPLPDNVSAALCKDGDLTPLMGTFRVCPLERSRPGWMLHVCIQSASHLALDVGHDPHR